MKSLNDYIESSKLHLKEIYFIDNLNEELNKIKYTNHSLLRSKGDDDINYKKINK